MSLLSPAWTGSIGTVFPAAFPRLAGRAQYRDQTGPSLDLTGGEGTVLIGRPRRQSHVLPEVCLADAPAGRRFRGGYTDCLAQLGLGPGPPGPVRTGLLIAGARSPTISSCPESR